MTPRRILVVSGGAEAVPGIERVKALRVRVAVADGDENAPGMALADTRVVCSTYDVQGMIEAARALHADSTGLAGVMAMAADVPVTVARVAAELGLPGIPVEAAEACADKLAMKDRLADGGVALPWYAAAASAADVEAARAEHGTVVVKPVDSRGARGVVRVTADVDAAWALEHARSVSPSGRAMIESFLEGPQLSTESVVVDGVATTLGCSDRNYARLEELAPFMIEDGGVQPSEHLDAVLGDVNALITRCAASLGIKNGTLKGDLVWTREGLRVIEVAPRLSGGWFATDQIPYSTGVDFVQLAARIAMGERPTCEERTPAAFRPVAVRFFFPPAGHVEAVEGFHELQQEPWCLRAVLYAQPGTRIDAPTDHTRRAGLILTTGETNAEAVRRAQAAVERVRFDLR